MNSVRVRLVVCAGVFLLASSLAWADDFIVEARREGQNFARYREIAGKWYDSQIPVTIAKSHAPGLTPGEKCGARKALFSGPNVVPEFPAAARFMPLAQKRTHYHVYVTWPKAANASVVPYAIKHADGIAVKTVVQDGWGRLGAKSNADTWVSLGDYDFDPGTDQYVECQMTTGAKALETNWFGQVYADAARFSTDPITNLGTPPPAQPPPQWEGGQPATVVATSTPGASVQLQWIDDLDAGMRKASAENKKLMIFFYTPMSNAREYYESRVFANAAVASILSPNYVLVRIDLQQRQDLVQKMQVFKAGVIYVYDSKGTGLARFTDRMTPEEFLTRIRGL